MGIGLIGRKCGMTRIPKGGALVPVSVIQIEPNRVVQKKTIENDGYNALQVTMGTRKHVNKPSAGHFRKAQVEPGCGLWETGYEDVSVGHVFSIADIFKVGSTVDVTGTTKGKGFAGVIKRHHFQSQDATHGNSVSHRAPGSIGQRQTPGRVFKNKKMAGHLGDVQRTIPNLEIVAIDEARNLLMVKGAIPGCPTSIVVVRSSSRDRNKGGE